MQNQTLLLLGAAHVHLADHLRHVEDRGWRIGAIHDRDTERRDRLCADLNAEPLDSLEAIAQTGCVGAIVCSETAHHEADISAALTAGLPVFSEKPLAASADAAQRCADLAEDKGILLHTGYFFRTNTALKQLKSALEDGMIGRIIDARMRFSHDGGYADWLDLDCWMTDPALACYDGFVDEAVHVIDMLQWLVGPISAGHAVTGNALGWPLDDHGAAAVTFENGATGVVEAGWTDTTMRLEIALVGENGAAQLADGDLTVIKRGADTPALTATIPPLDAGEGIEPFLDALEGKDTVDLVPPRAAVSVNALLDAMALRRC
ncbi:Gfo/Idh/MocA family oxidoreductase [Marivita sp.]|uniref:Gfo/Idh/MocA family protein n=1 Tax=Marivita sp. TaxID=2003365 RepID=UPI0025BDD56F|nr:Gfo/Idh/MocA family oxidoreductase [Marivita sp.]